MLVQGFVSLGDGFVSIGEGFVSIFDPQPRSTPSPEEIFRRSVARHRKIQLKMARLSREAWQQTLDEVKRGRTPDLW